MNRTRLKYQIGQVLSRFIVVALLLDSFCLAEPQDRTEAEQWVLDNYSRALDLLLGGPPNEIDTTHRVEWSIRVRILSEDKTEAENQFYLRKFDDGGKVEAIFVTPTTDAIFQRLKVLHGNKPASSIDQIAPQVEISRLVFNSMEMPELQHLARQLEETRMSPVIVGSLYMHPTLYRLDFDSRWGNGFSIVIAGPGSEAPQQPNPLLKWAEDCRSFLRKQSLLIRKSQ